MSTAAPPPAHAPQPPAGVRPEAGRCGKWLPMKGRFCRFMVRAGEVLCAEHQGEEQTRVPCPYDSSHTVWLKQMDRHLAKCPRRPRPLPVYAQPGVNIPPSPLAPPQPQEAQPAPSLKSVPAEQLKSLIARLRLLMAAHPLTIAHHIPQHPFMQDEIAAKKAQGHSYKHLVQMSSMLGHLQERGLLREGQAVVELGAGKAQFLTAMRRVIGWQSSAAYIAVDRMTRLRQRSDKYHRNAPASGVTFDRLVIDIADLNLARVPSLQSTPLKPVLACSKHLCGAATDLTITCLANYVASANPAPLSGLVVALCCHHRCSLETYCNPDFILHECRLTPAEFSLVQTMSAWGTLSPEFDPTEDPANRHGYGSLKERFHAMNAYAAAANAPRAESNLGGFAAELGGSSESEKRRADTTDERSRSNDQDAVVAQPPAKIAAVEHSESANGDGAATKSDPQDGEDDDEDDEEVDEHAAAAEEHCATATATCARLGLSYAELIQVGQMCKRLLDIGRMKRLEQLGLKCELMVYALPVITPENVLLIATPESS